MSALILLAICSQSLDVQSAPQQRLDQGIVDRARQMNVEEYEGYVDQLSKKRDLRTLLILVRANLGSTYAVVAYTSHLNCEQHIAFCTTLELSSFQWGTALNCLANNHPKQQVIGYVKQLSTSNNLEVRYQCYKLCRLLQWQDLIDVAKQDANNNTLIGLPSLPRGETLGKEAERYIKAVSKP